jgi:hypothetical protein
MAAVAQLDSNGNKLPLQMNDFFQVDRGSEATFATARTAAPGNYPSDTGRPSDGRGFNGNTSMILKFFWHYFFSKSALVNEDRHCRDSVQRGSCGGLNTSGYSGCSEPKSRACDFLLGQGCLLRRRKDGYGPKQAVSPF